MVLFNLSEIIDIIVMAFVIGFIFKDAFPRRPKVEVIMPEDPLERFNKRGFRWDDFWFAVAVVGPSIIFHEFGHKFVAIGFGLAAEFHAAYTWLAIGLVLKLIGLGFIFFVPAYVTVAGAGTQAQLALVSFAGPAINLILWLGARQILKNKKLHRKINVNLYHVIYLTSKINMFLFIFNLLPIPGFDGWNFYGHLIKMFF